jgi:glucosamine--fructose-6-phosphate aminotransferase (isomerizing)
MCGIVGYIGRDAAVSFLTPALKRLEYRGYDSAGVATVNGHGLQVTRAVGKIANLEAALAATVTEGRVGIAHTRWATHGRPSERNAHPHVDCQGRVAVVHNGIIENHRELRQELTAEGHLFASETDTEVFAHLVERYLALGLPDAVRRAGELVRGAFAVACIAEDSPDMIVALRGGSSPLVLGWQNGEAFLASDVPALLGKTAEGVVLADGDLAVLTRDGVSVRQLSGEMVTRTPIQMPADSDAVEKNGYAHFMLKEIFEQPKAIADTLLERVDARDGRIHLPEIGLRDEELAKIARVAFLACGSSWNAGLVGQCLIESFGGLPATVEIASEFRHRQPVLGPDLLAVPISQSGETADTLGALRVAAARGARTVAICNRVGSSMTREVDGVLYTRAGLEIGVAATKSFTTQVVAVTLLALQIAQVRGTLGAATRRDAVKALLGAPALMQRMLERSDDIRRAAERLLDYDNCLYLGRGLQFPLALEGALKLKEISYVHAEGYPAGEMKHGPIALIDERMPVVALAPSGPTLTQMVSNIQEVKARNGVVVALVTEGDDAAASLADCVIAMPPAPAWAQPLLLAVPLQLLAYHLAVLRGCDVDQPRNLAKSVTVE